MGQGGDVGGSSWKPSATSAGGTVITSGGQPIGADPTEDEDDSALKPLPERLVMELTAHRTLALREAIGRSPDVALTLVSPTPMAPYSGMVPGWLAGRYRFDEIGIDVAALAARAGARWIEGELAALDPDRRRAVLADVQWAELGHE